MKYFRKKNFSLLSSTVKSTGGFVKKNPTIPLSAAMLSTSVANYKLNTENARKASEDNKTQLKAINKLTRTLTKVDGTLKETVHSSVTRRSLFSSLKSDIIKGASTGLGLGALVSGALPIPMVGRLKVMPKKIGNVKDDTAKRLIITAGSTLLGAGLAALSHAGRKLTDTRPDNRLGDAVVKNLRRSFKEGIDFTRDSKVATRLNMRVCIVVTQSGGDLKLLINTVADPKLATTIDELIRNFPKSEMTVDRTSTKYNEVTITTISEKLIDVNLVTGLCSQFIKKGYPVYLVEVGG